MGEKVICMHCGAQVADDQRFCHNCGSLMPETGAKPVIPASQKKTPSQQNRRFDIKKEPDPLLAVADEFLYAEKWEEAEVLYVRKLQQDPQCASAWLGRALKTGRSKTPAELVQKLHQQFEMVDVQMEAIPENREFIEACVLKYTEDGTMSAHDVRERFRFDLTYPSAVSGSLALRAKMEELWKNDSFLGKAYRYAEDEQLRNMLYATKSDMLSWGSESVIQAQKDAEQAKQAKQNQYAAFLQSVDRELEETRLAALERAWVSARKKKAGRVVLLILMLLLVAAAVLLAQKGCQGTGVTPPETTTMAPEQSATMSVEVLPEKQVYYVGQMLDTSGLQLQVVHPDGTVKTITEGFTCSPEKLDQKGIQTITVTYEDMRVEFVVEVEAVSTTGVELASLPKKCQYFPGESLNTDGLKLKVQYEDGSEKTVDSGFHCNVDKLNAVGTQKVTVTYGEYTTSFSVEVRKPEVIAVYIDKLPGKLSYYTGDKLDTNGMQLVLSYNDGSTKTVTSGFSCSPTELTTSGNRKITVSYGNVSTEYTVEVRELMLASLSIKSMPRKTSYYVGDYLDTSGLVLQAGYSNGETKQVTSGYTTSKSQLTEDGTHTITVTYGSQTVQFSVTAKYGSIELTGGSSRNVSIDCWSGYNDASLQEPLWFVDLPGIYVENPSATVTWQVFHADYSGAAYMRGDRIAIKQPGRIIVTANVTNNGCTIKATQSITITMYKQADALNYIQAGPSLNSQKIGEITNFYVVITEVSWNWSVKESDGKYWLYGKINYNGQTGWIVIS